MKKIMKTTLGVYNFGGGVQNPKSLERRKLFNNFTPIPLYNKEVQSKLITFAGGDTFD